MSLPTTKNEKAQSTTPLSGHWPGCSAGRRRVNSSHRRRFCNRRRRATGIATLPGRRTPRPGRREPWPWRARRNPRPRRSGRSGASPTICGFRRGPCTGGSPPAISWSIGSESRCGSPIMICEPFWRSTEMPKRMSYPVIKSHYMTMTYSTFGNTVTNQSSPVFCLTYSRISLSVILCHPEALAVVNGSSR